MSLDPAFKLMAFPAPAMIVIAIVGLFMGVRAMTKKGSR